jgi:hypothetical protein
MTTLSSLPRLMIGIDRRRLTVEAARADPMPAEGGDQIGLGSVSTEILHGASCDVLVLIPTGD